MKEKLDSTQLIDQIIEIAEEAGRAIMGVYNSDFNYQLKTDLSPLTKADKISHQIICNRLMNLTPNIPILSEEDCDISFEARSQWEEYWLIDPLDGTKEFIKKNGEFTVNIALISDNLPVFGVINIPVFNQTYWGHIDIGSFIIEKNKSTRKLNITKSSNSTLKIIASLSHPSNLLNKILERIDDYEILNKGSSLKFCLVASGKADLYPRFVPTCEWDTAAGQAIIKYAGGYIKDIDGKEITYNTKESFVNPSFIASNDNQLIERIIKLTKN
jgi:3'(2'), 5'-bisphosphate nucleotidase